jgi:long-chain acyl-CoA synthetase
MLLANTSGQTDQAASPAGVGLLGAVVRPGQTIVLRATNTAQTARTLIDAVQASIRVLVVSNATCASQLDIYAKSVGACGVVDIQDGTAIFQPIADAPEPDRDRETGIYILSSGSTGQPKTVFRPLRTWMAEGARYRAFLNLTSSDRVLILSPISHAYGLGFLWGAHQAGAAYDLVAPTDMGAAINRMTSWATHACVTPNIAKLLALRTQCPRHGGPLRVVMVGAGPITAGQDQDFERAFGLRLSTNYGSTEAGGVFAAHAPVEAGQIGAPMPGVSVLDTGGDDTGFALKIRVEGSGLHAMGDIVTRDAEVYRMVGREGQAIRRGERWVAPIVIEAALQAHDAIVDCKVEGVAGRGAGNDRIGASIVVTTGSDTTPAALLEHCKTVLSPHEVPDRIDLVAHIHRNERGKVPSRPTFRLGDTATLVDALNGYKITHLLFGLDDSGILSAIDAGQPLTQIAYERGVSADWLEQVLRVAEAAGLLTSEPGDTTQGTSLNAIRNYVDLERANIAGLNSVDMITQTLEAGCVVETSMFEAWREKIKDTYARAMNGLHKDVSRMHVMRRLRKRPAPLSLLDVSATRGGYTKTVIEHDIATADTAVTLPVGRIEDNGSAHPQPVDFSLLSTLNPERGFDVIVLDNALHHASVVAHFDLLVSRLAPDGVIVVDDLFLSDGAGALGVDWLTHGGIELLDEAALLRFATTKGLSVEPMLTEPRADHHHLYWLHKSC